MSKKLVISISVVIIVIAMALTLCWTLFALSSVSVELHSLTNNLTVTKQEIVEAGNFQYGSCVFFGGKKKAISNINNYVSENENFAYIRVVNIETKFPNRYVIHIVEREELFAIEQDGQYLICDRDFRILKIKNTHESTNENAILLKGVNVLDNDVKVGDFIDVKQSEMKKFYSIMLKNNRTLEQQLGKFKEINLTDYQDEVTGKEYYSLEMTTFLGKKLVINNPNFAFEEKIQKLFAVESAIYKQNTDQAGNILDQNGQIQYVVKSNKNEYILYNVAKDLVDENGDKIYQESDKVALTYDLISNCFIKVDNLTLTNEIKRTEKDIFYCFVEL